MSDYNQYNFTIKEKNLLQFLKDAAALGCEPLVVVNGMYYNLELENIPSADSVYQRQQKLMEE